ncbi:DUF979 domain-containing protein [Sphingomonas sp.]|jgi:uncharacterized membrane protein|uniref:DUF979 domain-containing protein n=1 Tax=Sphingomonas sp. TaxID=28214 RepID=UPI002D80304E|nr:DUF979 domain-containing protein [Sphingomonas sp.]HEU0042939.1 DUF979 domain-containing protein [Sphingomonas sp.]
MIGLQFIYTVAGVMFALYALVSLYDRRPANGAFWALLALSFLAGDRIADVGNGVLVLALVALAASGAMRGGRAGTDERPRGRAIFLPMLIVPAVALIGALAFRGPNALVDPKNATLVSLVAGALIALAVTCAWLRPAPSTPVREGLRLMDSIGWAAILPQMLASLGAIFTLAGVGQVVGGLVDHAIPAGSIIGAVAVYAVGMALFTMVIGNAFAAFPVMLAAVGLPLLIRRYGGDPAAVAALGMLAGFCGTLMTPMAANFNIVPAVLLDLSDRNGVIRAQIATALPLLAVNIAILYWFGFG